MAALVVPATILLSPSLCPKVSRVEPRSREYTLDFQSSSCCTIRVDEGETTVRSFLSRLRNDKNLVGK